MEDTTAGRRQFAERMRGRAVAQLDAEGNPAVDEFAAGVVSGQQGFS